MVFSPICSNITQQKSFIEKANNIHAGIYDYSLVEYIKSSVYVSILCKNHGIFKQTPNSHLNGRGCSKCSGKFKKDSNLFINDAKKIHGNVYNYDSTCYINCKTKVTIECKLHGKFTKTPSKHLSGQGCPKCARKNSQNLTRKTNQIFINQSKNIHKNLYEYNNVIYINAKEKVSITCNKHGDFLQAPPPPDKHLQGSGCPKCSGGIISKISTDWINSFNNKNILIEESIKFSRKRKVDGYDPTTNTIYQFHGTFYHGDPRVFDAYDINKKLGKTYGQLYKETTLKDQEIIDWGYRLIVMWEYDWKLFKSGETK